MSDNECHERVVLVSVRGGGGGAKPKRKVAIALPPENDYGLFVNRVRKKLSLKGVGGIFHAESNIPVYNLSELQDIDDLIVEECEESAQPHVEFNDIGPDTMMSSQTPSSPNPGSLSATSSRKPRSSNFLEGSEIVQIDAESGKADGDEDKYARRGNPMYRMLLPFAPEGLLRNQSGTALPLTQKDIAVENGSVGRGSSKRRRKVSNPLDPRKLLLLFALASCMATMFLLYSRISTGPALGSAVLETRDHVYSSETLNLGTTQ
mmetsp:Transcript_6843/g.12767  ORF Transcript_6843/g.12767 Transcript_6843/m.12767 type:complete len:263 (+) Transcript_6843:313-1101(+)